MLVGGGGMASARCVCVCVFLFQGFTGGLQFSRAVPPFTKILALPIGPKADRGGGRHRSSQPLSSIQMKRGTFHTSAWPREVCTRRSRAQTETKTGACGRQI